MILSGIRSCDQYAIFSVVIHNLLLPRLVCHNLFAYAAVLHSSHILLSSNSVILYQCSCLILTTFKMASHL